MLTLLIVMQNVFSAKLLKHLASLGHHCRFLWQLLAEKSIMTGFSHCWLSELFASDCDLDLGHVVSYGASVFSLVNHLN